MTYRQRSIRMFLLCLLGLEFNSLVYAKQFSPEQERESDPGRADTGQPLTEDECKKFANSLEKAIASGNVTAADKLVDLDAILESAMAGVDAPESCRRSFAQGFKSDPHRPGNAMQMLADAVRRGGSYSLLRVHTTERERRVLFRVIFPAGGFTYHDWILGRRTNGQILATDLYVFSAGERISQALRRLFLPAAVQASKGLSDRLARSDQDFIKESQTIKGIAECLRDKKYPEGLAAYEQLSPAMKKEKNILLLRFGLGRGAGEKEVVAAFQDLLRYCPDDPCVDVIGIDVYILKEAVREGFGVRKSPGPIGGG